MAGPKPGLGKLIRAFFAIGFAVLLIGTTTSVSGAVPMIAGVDELTGLEGLEDQEDETRQAEATALKVEPEPVAIPADDFPTSAEVEAGLDMQATQPSGTEQLLQSLNQLNATLSPLAAGSDNCNSADPGTGAYADTLCWLDFSGFTTQYQNLGSFLRPNWHSTMDPKHTVSGSQRGGWGDIKNYPVSVDLGGGYILTAELDTTGDNSADKQVVAQKFPTWSDAFLGNRDFYTGVAGKPALYQTGNGGQTTLKLKDIELKKDGIPLRNYSVVVADAESTDSNEWIEWSTTGAGFRWLPNKPGVNSKIGVMGNTCTAAGPAWNSTTPQQNAYCRNGGSGSKTGTAMLATEPPVTGDDFQITQRMKGNGLQGVAFGVIIARAAVQTEVTDRIVNDFNQAVDQTNFSGVILQGGTQIATTQTGTTAPESPDGVSALPVSTSGTQLKFASAASGDLASSYTQAWKCEKTNPTDGTTSYWPSQSTTSPNPPQDADVFTRLSVGQYLKCKITYSPPYLTLVKKVDNGMTGALHTAADFILQATRQSPPESMIQVPGNQAATVTRRAVAVGQYTLKESNPDPETAGNWPYGYDWTDLDCKPMKGSTPLGEFTTTPGQNGTIVSANLRMDTGNNITCTYHNVAREPQLIAEKAAFDASGDILARDSVVDSGEVLSYKLKFHNSGTAEMQLDYRDHLGDVLDDAQFIAGSVRISDGEETTYPENMPNPGITVAEQLDQPNPQLAITGTVQRGQTRTVWFKVSVFPNQHNAQSRQQGGVSTADDSPNQVGYMLNNYLLPAGTAVPGICAEPVEGEPSTCTQNPIPSWSVAKDSRPADGARLHKGGNTHYQITATKRNSATAIKALVFEDDLTHVFKTAGWAPGAAVPGGALKRGIYFFDASDQSLNAEGEPIGSIAVPAAAYNENSGYVPAPTLDAGTGRWTLTSLPVDLPDNAMRAEMWFAVEAGQRPENIPDNWPDNSNPSFGSRYVNYVRARAQDTLLPNQCSLTTTDVPDTSAKATVQAPQDTDFPEACRVIHQMSDNYFTIRKDVRGAGIKFPESTSEWGDSTGLTNMVGHKFEIRDDQGGVPSAHPSVKLCRAEYHPDTWDGNFIADGNADWGEDSATLAAIIEHNNALPENDPNELPLCGLFYPQGTYGGKPPAGGQDGRWRSEYLRDGDYWLVETKAPDRQINNAGTSERPVPGVQLLAQPIAFTVWPEMDAPYFGPENPQQSMEGRGQLDIKGLDQQRCFPGASVGSRPVACVNPTGYLMIVQDVVPLALPLSGGGGTSWLMITGGAMMSAVLLGLWLWRRNQSSGARGSENPV